MIKKYKNYIIPFLIFCLVGGGYTLYERWYKFPKQQIEEWIFKYEEVAEGEVVVDGREVYIHWTKIMRSPPVDVYSVEVHLGTYEGAPIRPLDTDNAILGLDVHRERIPVTFQARNWKDYRVTMYKGKNILIPKHIRPGKYSLLCFTRITTRFGIYEIVHDAMQFNLIQKSQ